MSNQESVNTSQAQANSEPTPTKIDLQTELAKLIPEMPEAARQQLAAQLDSTENPNPELKQQLVDGLQEFDSLTQTDSQVKAHLPEGTNEKTLAKELAKVDASQPILESEQQEAAAVFNLMFNSMLDSEPCDDIEEIRKFANAATLKEAFPQEEQFAFSTLVDEISEESAEIIHAAIACLLAGMTKPAKLLFKLFTQRQFIDANQGYQKLQTEITKQKGVIETAKKHSKKGQDSRHEKNRQRKEFSISLYVEKPYKNPKQSAERLFPTINDFANKINHPFTSEYQGFQTVYRWFLAESKNR